MNKQDTKIQTTLRTRSVRFERMVMLRNQAGLSQSALAKLAGITPSGLSMIEAGKREPIISTAFALADALNTTVDDLAGRTEHTRTEAKLRSDLLKAQQRLANIKRLAT